MAHMYHTTCMVERVDAPFVPQFDPGWKHFRPNLFFTSFISATLVARGTQSEL